MEKDHERPAGASDATVEAVGKLSEAYEAVIRARGRLYDFHQLMGGADLALGEAADMLAEAGHDHLAESVRRDVVGRNIAHGRWTFQLVEEFDDAYFAPLTAVEEEIRHQLMDGRRHVLESEMKDDRRSEGQPGHERRP